MKKIDFIFSTLLGFLITICFYLYLYFINDLNENIKKISKEYKVVLFLKKNTNLEILKKKLKNIGIYELEFLDPQKILNYLESEELSKKITSLIGYNPLPPTLILYSINMKKNLFEDLLYNLKKIEDIQEIKYDNEKIIIWNSLHHKLKKILIAGITVLIIFVCFSILKLFLYFKFYYENILTLIFFSFLGSIAAVGLSIRLFGMIFSLNLYYFIYLLCIIIISTTLVLYERWD